MLVSRPDQVADAYATLADPVRRQKYVTWVFTWVKGNRRWFHGDIMEIHRILIRYECNINGILYN